MEVLVPYQHVSRTGTAETEKLTTIYLFLPIFVLSETISQRNKCEK
jgi:hypothetical protein